MSLNWDDMERRFGGTDVRLNAMEYWMEMMSRNVVSIASDVDISRGRGEPLITTLTRCIRTLDAQLRNSAVLMSRMVDCISCPIKDDCAVKFQKFESLEHLCACENTLYRYLMGGNESVSDILSS